MPGDQQNGRRERVLLLVAATFVMGGVLTLVLCPTQPAACDASVDGAHLGLAVLAWALSFLTAHVTFCRRLPRRDPILLPVAALLGGWGLLLVARLSPNFLPRQALWLMLSALCMLGMVSLGDDLRWLRRFRYTWLLGGLALLAATLFFGVNPSGYGPRLWLGWGGIYFQPSEPLKLLMVVYLASYLAERRDLLLTSRRRIGRLPLPRLAYVGPLLVMSGLALLLLAWQQDLGAAMLFFFTFLVLLYVATGQWSYVAAGLVFFAAVGVAAYLTSARVAVRVDGWINPWPDAADRSFQIVQSLMAFGSGGLLGQGLGLGRPTYIPAVHTDFVFAAIGEEYGLAGTAAIVLLFGVLMLRGSRIAVRASQSFERLLAAGLTAGLTLQAWVIMAGNARLAPIAGVTLPFVSYGGSSLLSTFITLGLLLRVSCSASETRPLREVPPSASILRVTAALVVALVLLAGVCGYWGVARASWLSGREDNPRRVEYEQRILRGEILDRHGTVLATVAVDRLGTATRVYPVAEAAPVVGYASLRHGTGGVEAVFDLDLRGEACRSPGERAWARLLHRPPEGQDLQLTVDGALQVAAQEALAGESGAVVLLDADSGDVLAMASAPTFDPGGLDEDWDRLRDAPDAPLLNRAVQGLYQPGSALQTVALAEAVEQGLASLLGAATDVTATVRLDGVEIGCREDLLPPSDLAAAYRAACPGPFAALGEQMGVESLLEGASRWGLLSPVPLEVPVETGAWAAEDASLEAVGQGSLTVSPLHMAMVAATLARDGSMPSPRLVLRRTDCSGVWQPVGEIGEAREVISSDLARALLSSWTPYGPNTLGHLGSAVAGEGRPPHAWFLGVASGGESRYAVAVLLEHAERTERAAEVGSLLLEAVLGR